MACSRSGTERGRGSIVRAMRSSTATSRALRSTAAWSWPSVMTIPRSHPRPRTSQSRCSSAWESRCSTRPRSMTSCRWVCSAMPPAAMRARGPGSSASPTRWKFRRWVWVSAIWSSSRRLTSTCPPKASTSATPTPCWRRKTAVEPQASCFSGLHPRQPHQPADPR